MSTEYGSRGENLPFIQVTHVEKEGIIVAKEFIIINPNGKFLLNVGTPEYINDLRESDKESGETDSEKPIFAISQEDILSTDLVSKLKQVPFKQLAPYLIPQSIDEEE